MAGSRRFGSRRGSEMIEGALAMMVFAVILAAIMELGFTGFVSNSVAFAAERAARYASVRGSTSGHPAAVADIQATAQSYAAPLSSSALTVNVTWSPNNHPGSTVQVQVCYSIAPLLLPISSHGMTLQSTASQTITQ